MEMLIIKCISRSGKWQKHVKYNRLVWDLFMIWTTWITTSFAQPCVTEKTNCLDMHSIVEIAQVDPEIQKHNKY